MYLTRMTFVHCTFESWRRSLHKFCRVTLKLKIQPNSVQPRVEYTTTECTTGVLQLLKVTKAFLLNFLRLSLSLVVSKSENGRKLERKCSIIVCVLSRDLGWLRFEAFSRCYLINCGIELMKYRSSVLFPSKYQYRKDFVVLCTLVIR